MVFDAVPAAKALLQIRRSRGEVWPLPEEIAPSTTVEGAAVQLALAELVGAMPPAGFKIGAIGKRMQAYLGVDTPIAGFMRAEDVYHCHAELQIADFIRPAVECEVACDWRGICRRDLARLSRRWRWWVNSSPGSRSSRTAMAT
jgi:2-keto-4-pentenoate hydratase